MALKRIIKLVISVAMLLLVLNFVDFEQLSQTFRQIRPELALLILLAYALGQVLSSYKWWLIARCGSTQAPWSRAARAYFLGAYANCFGLGLVGGDVLRAVTLAGADSSKSQAIASVVADRAHGLAVLTVLGVVFSIFDGRDTISPQFIYVIMCLPVLVIAFWLIGPKMVLGLLPQGGRLYQKLSGAFEVFPRNPLTVLWITTISVVFHLSQIALHALMASALGLSIPWIILLSSVPFVNILCSLPISWNGLGVRENSYIFFLYPAFLSKEAALAFGALWLFAVTGSAAIGGVISVLSKSENKDELKQTA